MVNLVTLTDAAPGWNFKVTWVRLLLEEGNPIELIDEIEINAPLNDVYMALNAPEILQ